ncbi:MATE family efflux transporter DinF [Vibrio sp. FNV 38]|nr:MATE family efflux transporter DinF [Vibrio sp. FNV 38]
MNLSFFNDKAIHSRILALALPMVLSNITVPLLGLVDAAVIGHLEHAWYLGGVALGGTMISVTFWLFGFLRMSTTGLTAQSAGAQDKHALGLTFLQGSAMALLFATLFLLLHQSIAEQIFAFSDASEDVKLYGAQYFTIRAWSAPAALMNFVLLGWLLGTQNAKAPMWVVIITNVTNIVLDVFFVLGLGWKVEGAAFASVIADYSGMGFGLWCVINSWRKQNLPHPSTFVSGLTNNIGRFIRLNRDIFLRSLCLQLTLSFMTFQGASYGDNVVAANAVLMSFVMIISYGMDGFAYAMEAMVGKAIGGRNRDELKETIMGTFFWGIFICLMLSFLFFFFGQSLVGMITSIDSVKSVAMQYLPWLVAMPLISLWAFLFDGLFIGATKGKEMRNSMFIATCFFFAIFFLASALDNHALWLAMSLFMGMRGVGLGIIFIRQWRCGQFLA